MILVFDTETTGMVDFKKPPSDPCQPRLVQFAGMVIDEDRVVKSISCIVFPEVDIPAEVSKIHGISNEFAKKVGVHLSIPCGWYYEAISKCDLVVAHNVDFDVKVMESQIHYLNSLSPNHLRTPAVREKLAAPGYPEHPEVYDTMKKSTSLLKLKGKFGNYKWPKLIELYRFLFNEDFDGAHDAMEDVRATFRCYKKMVEMEIK